MAIQGLDAPLSAPALRALEGLGIGSLRDFAKHTRAAVEEAHGIGKTALRAVEAAMRKAELEFRDEEESAEVGAYIAGFGGEARAKLEELRVICRKALPKAREKIAYGMPTYFYGENIIHFAGFAKHVSVFPLPETIDRFKSELRAYSFSKGGIQFPLDQPLPKKLVREIAEFRLKSALAKLIG